MKTISFTLNNQSVSIQTNLQKRLVDVLREDFALTGVKEGCGEGECGACAVLANHKLINSCITPIGSVEQLDIMSIEGFRDTERYHVLAAAFAAAGAVQCGFCTPGMLLAAEALLHVNASPNETEIRQALSGNLCRCTGYSMIVDAVKIAAKNGDGLW